jgi:tRNA threonylcarbamoyladenosine biosynthesis protein TsaE
MGEGTAAVVTSASPEETRALGAALADVLRERDVVLLTGELGAGKTTLVQGIVSGLGSHDHVQSPTFTLVREYTGRLVVAHVDVYRLERVQDVVDLGLEEIADGKALLLIEWGDAVQELFAPERLLITITSLDPTGAGDARRIELAAFGGSWLARWDDVQARLGAGSPA